MSKSCANILYRNIDRYQHEILFLFLPNRCYKLCFHIARLRFSSIRTGSAEMLVQAKKNRVYTSISFHSIHRLAQSHHAAIHGAQPDDGAWPGRRGLFISD